MVSFISYAPLCSRERGFFHNLTEIFTAGDQDVKADSSDSNKLELATKFFVRIQMNLDFLTVFLLNQLKKNKSRKLVQIFRINFSKNRCFWEHSNF